MKLQTVLLPLLFLATVHAQGAPVAKPAVASKSASTPAPVSTSASRPIGSTAVEAADNAQEPGKLRPENRVVPQIVLPLSSDRNSRDSARGSASPTAGQIDESAARCAAQKTKAARQDCKAGSK